MHRRALELANEDFWNSPQSTGTPPELKDRGYFIIAPMQQYLEKAWREKELEHKNYVNNLQMEKEKWQTMMEGYRPGGEAYDNRNKRLSPLSAIPSEISNLKEDNDEEEIKLSDEERKKRLKNNPFYVDILEQDDEPKNELKPPSPSILSPDPGPDGKKQPQGNQKIFQNGREYRLNPRDGKYYDVKGSPLR
jgi:hypothetical protein